MGASDLLSASRWPFFPLGRIIGVLLLWLVLISQVRHHWGGESYYNFGWFVPFLALWLLLRNLSLITPLASGKSGFITLILAVAAIILCLPFHALAEVNPFWRVPLWAQVISCLLFTAAATFQLYGAAGLRAIAFPLFFLVTMVPWPYRVETAIVQALTQVVVSLSMSGLNFLGYPVELAGNSFVLGELQIGVNEACSGIRSLQALFMITLFLGSLFGQGTLRRLLAVLVLPTVVIIVNTGRAIFLSTQVIVNGNDAYDKWHDPAGYIAFIISMVLIYACIEILNIGSDGEAPNRQLSLQAFRPLQKLQGPLGGSLLFLSLPLALFASVEAWFIYHESTSESKPDWSFVQPVEDPNYIQYADIHPQIETSLGYDYGLRFYYRIRSRVGGEVYFYGYNPENKLSSVSSYGHSPAICMEASGATILREYDPFTAKFPDLSLVFDHYRFALHDSSEELHVFWIVWETMDMNIPPEALASLDYKTQWVQLLKGRRDFSRKVLLISLSGIDDPEDARSEIDTLLRQWINPGAS
jgi:exosortase